jgi:acyl dehydratase
LAEARRLSFEDLAIGQIFTSHSRTLTETDLSLYSMLTGDWHPIHADEDFARTTKLGQRMFQGSFGIALAIALSADLMQLRNPIIAALGIRDWSFKSPLVVADTVHVELEIADKRVTSDGRRAVIGRRLRLLKSDKSVAQEGTADLMVGL